VSAGSRFSKIVDKVEYDVKEFITAFEDAVKAEFAEGFNIEQLRQEQTEKREKAAQEFVESYKEEAKESSSELSAEEIHEQLNISIKALDSSQRTKVTKGLKEILGGTANYTKTDDIDLLQKCLDLVAEIAE
jgi:ferritin